jgi:spermidine synthase
VAPAAPATTVGRSTAAVEPPVSLLTRPSLGVVLALTFLSGGSGLIYQVVWFRKLGLIFGVTSYALGIVLAAFMGGLAIGGLLGGWLADRTRRPLRAYALTEIVLGVLGLAVLWELDGLQAAYVSLADPLRSRPESLAALRFLLALLVLLPPTICMGATLPLLARATGSESGSAMLSRLYAANTAGAVFGTLLAGFLLIGLLGLRAAAVFAAALNIGVGAYLLVVAREALAGPARPAAGPAPPPPAATAGAPAPAVAVLAFAVSGLTGLGYEVIWSRLAGVLVFGLTYGFTAMLAVLLTGIALGSALYARWTQGGQEPVWQLAWLQVAIGALVGTAPLWLAGLADPGLAAGLTGPLLRRLADRNVYCASCTTVLPGLLALVFVTSVLFGAAFPAAVRACTGTGPRWAKRFGSAYAANVLGAVIGSLIAGFVLLPWFGAHVSLLLLATLNVAAGIALALSAGRPRRALVMLLIGGLPLVIALTAGRSLDVYRTVLASRVAPDAQILWYREGIESSVAITRERHRQSATQEPVNRLLINGDYHSSTAPSELAYHQLLGHLGPLLHPAASDVLVVGLAGGTSAGAAALHPGARVHVVEISDAVFEAADRYAPFNYDVLKNPRATFRNDDGRNHLLVGGQRYDVIEADLLYPRHVGSGVIYSYEYFQLVRRSLKPGGLAIQWLGPNSATGYGSWTLRTFASVFPYVTYWADGVAVGSNEPQPPIDPARFERLQRDPVLRAALAEAGLTDVGALQALRNAEPPAAQRDGPPITDDRPAIEYFLTLPLLSRLTESP